MLRTNTRILRILMALTVASFVVIAGCSTKSTLDTGVPANATVTISATPTTIEQNQTTVVEATVTDGGNGVANQVVTFSVTPPDAGFFSPASDTTDASGVAATVFTGTKTGDVTITASIAGSTLSGTIALAVNQAAQTGSGNVNVSVSPSLLLANGTDTAQVTIAVRDELGQPAPDGTVIKITAGEKFVDVDGNGYWSDGIDSLVFDANANGTWDGIGLIPSTATTSGGTGTAVVNYISGNDAFTVYIKVTVDDNGISGWDEFTLQLSPNTTVGSIYLVSDSLSLSVKQTGGIETSQLRATCFDVNGNPVPEGITVNFLILDGPGGGEGLGNSGYGPFVAVTNSQGMASAPVHSGTVSGTIRIRAYVDTILSNAAQVLVAAGPPAYIVVGAEKCNVPWWDGVGFMNPIVAVVSDIYHNPVNDSTVVYFSTDEGTIMSHEKRTEKGQGIATSNWIAGTNVPTADGIVKIYAETAGGTVADTSFFYNTFVTDTLIVTGMPSSMPADGQTTAIVTVTGLDFNGLPVVGGTKFEGDAVHLGVPGGTLEDGCFTSSDRVKIQSKTLKQDESLTGANDDGIGAVDIVTFWNGTAATAIPVTLTTGFAHRASSSINVQSSANAGEALPVSVTIVDRNLNPLGDHTLTLTASGGVVTGGTQETDGYGEASGFTWTAPATAGDYTLTITDTDPRGGIVLTKTVTVN
ncbi:MAG: hypothetical protein D6800_12070 [Candidatus Zixiibacteriota bacterium]|nr:MAG: hypothetical protein D6800_12070 [candidate division Zixibacteria bacterium]